MPAQSQFVDYLTEQLAPLGDVTAKSMFGSWELFTKAEKLKAFFNVIIP